MIKDSAMSFKEFNDEGPGTFEWDFVLGGNTTGLFPEETHYVLEGNQLTEVIFTHKGGGSLEPSGYGETYTVENISSIEHPLFGQPWFTFEQGESKFKATLNKNYKQHRDCYVIDLTEI